MSLEAVKEPVIVIDKQAKSVKSVQEDIASLQARLAETGEGTTGAPTQHHRIRERIDYLSSALTAAGFLVQPTSH